MIFSYQKVIKFLIIFLGEIDSNVNQCGLEKVTKSKKPTKLFQGHS